MLWVCMSDFNEVLSLNELDDLRPRPNWQLRNFRNMVDEYAFIDLRCQGYRFTWANNPHNEATYSETRRIGFLLQMIS